MRIKLLYVVFILAVPFFIFSCSEMNDLHDKYLNEGEIIYAAKVDSAVVYPGKERVLIKMIIESQRIGTVRIFWNDFKDSTDVSIQNNVGDFEVLIESLEERAYIFQLVSIDQFGNRSLPFELSGEVYGDNYEDELLTRAVKIINSVDGLAVTLSSAYDDNIATEISYTHTTGEIVSVSIPSSEDSYKITDNQSGSEFTVSSTYAPNGGIDTLYSPPYSINGPYLFDVKDMSIIDYSTQHSPGENAVVNIISGSYELRWHTRAGGSSYPHHATIDLGAGRMFTKLGVWRSVYDLSDDQIGDDRAPDKIQFLVSEDNESWIDLGIYDFNRFMNGEQFYEFPPTKARYLKLVAVSGPQDYMVLGGINIYGY